MGLRGCAALDGVSKLSHAGLPLAVRPRTSTRPVSRARDRPNRTAPPPGRSCPARTGDASDPSWLWPDPRVPASEGGGRSSAATTPPPRPPRPRNVAPERMTRKMARRFAMASARNAMSNINSLFCVHAHHLLNSWINITQTSVCTQEYLDTDGPDQTVTVGPNQTVISRSRLRYGGIDESEGLYRSR